MSNKDTPDDIVFQHDTDGSDKMTKTEMADMKAEISTEEHAHLSVGDVLRGTAVHQLTPFERKAALINA